MWENNCCSCKVRRARSAGMTRHDWLFQPAPFRDPRTCKYLRHRLYLYLLSLLLLLANCLQRTLPRSSTI